MAKRKTTKTVNSSLCGFCQTKNHDRCVGRYQRWIYEQRKKEYVQVLLDEWRECNCKRVACKKKRSE